MRSAKTFLIGAAYGLTAAAALVLNIGEAYRDEIWPRLIRQSDVAWVITSLIGDRPVMANVWMGQGCSAAVCMYGEAIVSGIRLNGPFDRDQIRVSDGPSLATLGSQDGAGISIKGPLLLSIPGAKP